MRSLVYTKITHDRLLTFGVKDAENVHRQVGVPGFLRLPQHVVGFGERSSKISELDLNLNS